MTDQIDPPPLTAEQLDECYAKAEAESDSCEVIWKQYGENVARLAVEQHEARIRRDLALAYNPLVYKDNGELSDCSVHPHIDFKRDTFERIGQWLRRRAEIAQDGRRAEVEALRAERNNARARVDRAVQLLTRVHSLMYPAPVKMPDGQTMVFRPKSLDPHEVLQELSDRIRAIPDELDALAKEKAS